jgi:O-antigen ligase
MAESKKEEKSYLQDLLGFYFAPELRSLATIFHLVVFGYFALFYLDSVFLAIRFLWYIATDSTALMGIPFLLSGMAFVLCLILPFSVSVYSIFVMHSLWAKPDMRGTLKWIISLIVIIGSFVIIALTDEGARAAARQPAMQSFVEDANLTGKI